ncbi:NAD(P)H-binding protein [Kitasatospora sp. NBC_01287]|uniref:SDR family oxidoreductase n=1 Tax=Kitasatospora sp. NBC_01287 TaxID=2903573 RepID=UPI002250B42C|nr:NAD(P)H-binding protein [Kitasatospora sp. NBC_01287]MCX4751684.1 NAD(P)H-binding protein [Kitasatospora sp. NBC_01287]
MRIAIIGGTGTLGRPLTEELRARGHQVRVLSRGSAEYPVDLRTGVGLIEALTGCEAVVDASNDRTRKAERTLVAGNRLLLEAERRAGVGHHVCVSIVGCERVPLAYFRVKVAQEQVVEQGPVPWTILRATQFHELVTDTLESTARLRLLPLPRVRLRPIACAEAATYAADLVEAPPALRRIDLVGPRPTDLHELARAWRTATGRRVPLLRLPLPGSLGRALRAGALSVDHPELRGTQAYEQWLRARPDAAA